MSFGLSNAAQMFQRFIHEVLHGLEFTFAYLDDILIASQNEEQHYKYIEMVCKRLSDYGIRINASKCILGINELPFLGSLVNDTGIRLLPEHVKPVLDFEQPKMISQLRRFLRLINYYRRNISHASHAQHLLCEYLHEAQKATNFEIIWTPESAKAFNDCKTKLAEATLLAHPHPEAYLTLYTDASNYNIGAILNQVLPPGHSLQGQSLAFFSAKLTPAQQKWSTFDRELYAMYAAIKHFKHMVEGREFTIYTDHCPLIYTFQQKLDKSLPWQLRHLDLIGQYSTDIRYIKGADNIPADSFSRIKAILLPQTIDYNEMAVAQQKDADLRELLQANSSIVL